MIADLLSTISKLPASNLAQSINESTSIDRNAQSAARQQTQGKTVDKNRLDNRISPPTKNELTNENKTEGEEKGERKRIKSQRLLDLGLFRGRVSGSSRLSIKVPCFLQFWTQTRELYFDGYPSLAFSLAFPMYLLSLCVLLAGSGVGASIHALSSSCLSFLFLFPS